MFCFVAEQQLVMMADMHIRGALEVARIVERQGVGVKSTYKVKSCRYGALGMVPQSSRQDAQQGLRIDNLIFVQ